MISPFLLGRDRYEVSQITAAPEQEPFCGSIASHFAADEPSCDFHMIRLDGKVIGLPKIDRDNTLRKNFACPGELGLRGVMIDRSQQGRGIGKAAMALLRYHLHRTYPDARTCVLTVNTINAAARAISPSAGFRDEGQLYLRGKLGTQHVLRLDLRFAGDTVPVVAPCLENRC